MDWVAHYRDVVQGYIDGVLSGAIVTSKWVRYAVERHVADLQHGTERGLFFDEGIAGESCAFFPLCLVHSTGEFAGQPFELLPWQAFFVWSIMGWRRVANGLRRFLRAYVEVARKNGKTALAAGLAILFLIFDSPLEPRAEIYCAATKESQADRLRKEAWRMVRKSPVLRDLFRNYKGKLVYLPDDGEIVAVGSDGENQDGLNPHLVVKDEVHAWRERHRSLNEVLSTGGGARRQPFELIITTAGTDRSMIWQEERAIAETVVMGMKPNDDQFALIFTLDSDDEIHDPAVWPKANPSIGECCKMSYLQGQSNAAKTSKAKERQFKRYNLNLRVGSLEKAIDPDTWAKCAGVLPQLRGRRCRGAFDLGRTDDFAAVALTFPVDDIEGVDYILKTWAFTCEQGSDDRDLTAEPWAGWIRDGWLKVCIGDAVDLTEVQEFIEQLAGIYDVGSWAFDPTFSKQMSQQLTAAGLEVFSFTQAPYFYNEPCREFAKVVRQARLRHNGDPCLAWQAGNLVWVIDNKDRWMPAKGNGALKIDSMVAGLMSFSECLYHSDNEQSDVGIRFL